MFTETDMKNVIDAYELRGIATRDDCSNIDIRPLSKEILAEMHRRGYKEAHMTEAHLENFMDYSRAIYNQDKFGPREADEYLIKNVLRI